MSNTSYALIMMLAGIGIPVLATLNATLGRLISAPAAIAKVADAPKHLLLAGSLIAFYVLSITYIAPHFGVGNAVFFVLLGQLISAAAIDHFGLFGATQTPLTLMRGSGIAVMGLGVFLTQFAAR